MDSLVKCLQELPGEISKARQLLSLYLVAQTVTLTMTARGYCVSSVIAPNSSAQVPD